MYSFVKPDPGPSPYYVRAKGSDIQSLIGQVVEVPTRKGKVSTVELTEVAVVFFKYRKVRSPEKVEVVAPAPEKVEPPAREKVEVEVNGREKVEVPVNAQEKVEVEADWTEESDAVQTELAPEPEPRRRTCHGAGCTYEVDQIPVGSAPHKEVRLRALYCETCTERKLKEK